MGVRKTGAGEAGTGETRSFKIKKAWAEETRKIKGGKIKAGTIEVEET